MRIFFCVAMLSLAGCGGASALSNCMMLCSGCCTAAGDCKGGSEVTTCGVSGSLCVDCGSNMQCSGGACRAAAVCGPSNCSGCCNAQGQCAPGTNNTECGDQGGACSNCTTGSQTCTSNRCVAGPPMLPAGAKLVFTTSGEYTGNLGGIAGADQKCTAAATAGGLTGTYVAWISSDTQNALNHVTANGPWYLTCPGSTSYIKAFNNKAHLQSAPLLMIDCNEFGTQITGANSTVRDVWTGTVNGGATAASHCKTGAIAGSDWTSTDSFYYGQAGTFNSIIATTQWTDDGANGCGNKGHLYCFQN